MKSPFYLGLKNAIKIMYKILVLPIFRTCTSLVWILRARFKKVVSVNTIYESSLTKRILITFGGRQDRMELLVKYANELLRRKLIHQWHVWDLARTDSDKLWLQKTFPSRITVNLDKELNEESNYLRAQYQSFLLQFDLNVKRKPKQRVRQGKRQLGFENVYAFYSLNRSLFWNDLFIKCDDDIVFIDIEKMPGFIEFRLAHPEYNIVCANIVNNGVVAFFQQQKGIIPKELGIYEMPEGRTWRSVEQGNEGSLWENSDNKCYKLHDYFLRNVNKFMDLKGAILFVNKRFSINFISWLGLKPLLSVNWLEATIDDEQYLSCDYPKKHGLYNAIYLPLTVSHYSFYKQEETSFANYSDNLMGRYKRLLDQYLIQ